MCFDLQLCVKLVRRARIIGIDFLHPCFEAAESNLIATQAAPIEPQRLPRQPRKEGAIMADDDECPRITIEPAFQPVNRGKIKMVRRLIEQQQIRLTRQRTRSEEHTSELQSLMRISYAVFCLKNKTNKHKTYSITTTN